MEEKDTFILEEHYISDDDDDNVNYDVVSDGGEDDDLGLVTLADIERSIQRKEEALASRAAQSTAQVRCSVRPSLVDDFIRNFFIKMKLNRSLDSFNSEWYELQSKGKLNAEDIEVVPDIYLRNQELDEQVKALRVEVDKMKVIAAKAQGTWDKFRKERDFHRMHHKRVVQEKNKLIVDIKRLKKHYSSYEPTLNELRNKYEIAMKEKMLMRLERDRLVAKCEALEAQMKSLEESQKQGSSPNVPPSQEDPSLRGGRESRRRKERGKASATPLPSDDVVNPFLNLVFEAAPVGSYQLNKTFKGHLNSVSGLAFHPKKHILATVSDDETWKLWAVPNGELIMSGEGHKGWIADVDFHPRGSLLATSAGDSTVKVWDFVNASCSATFSDHTQAVWGCSWHHCGDFLVSCSMDHTSKLWDVSSQRCRQTFRGHVDSVNAVCFQPFSNNICTGSGDKTVSLWDIRSGLCIQTFYGHMNACNHVTFNLKGDTIASCDADGCVKLWDVRMVVERGQISGGQHPLNKVSFDRSGSIIAAACDDGTVKLFDAEQMEHTGDLRGHEDAVQAVLFDPFGKFLVSTGSDCTFRVWQ